MVDVQKVGRGTYLAMGVVFLAVGGSVAAVGAGIIPAAHSTNLPVLLAVGTLFSLAGLSMILQGIGLRAASFIGSLIGFLIAATMLGLFAYIFFFSGAIPRDAWLPKIVGGAFVGFFILYITLFVIAKLFPNGPVQILGERGIEVGTKTRDLEVGHRSKKNEDD